MCGRARTAAFVESRDAPPGVNPYELEIALVDSLKPGEIPVFACANSPQVAPWGELLTTAAMARGAAGALMDGCVRDVKAIREMGFPVFHGGIAPLDTKGRARIVALDIPLSALAWRSRPAISSSATPTAWSWCPGRWRRRCSGSRSRS